MVGGLIIVPLVSLLTKVKDKEEVDRIFTCYDEKIVVPYCVESSLSQIERKVGPEDAMWYRRQFTVEGSYENKRVLLHFEAVDNYAEVFINGGEEAMSLTYYTPADADGITFTADGTVAMDITAYHIQK